MASTQVLSIIITGCPWVRGHTGPINWPEWQSTWFRKNLRGICGQGRNETLVSKAPRKKHSETSKIIAMCPAQYQEGGILTRGLKFHQNKEIFWKQVYFHIDIPEGWNALTSWLEYSALLSYTSQCKLLTLGYHFNPLWIGQSNFPRAVTLEYVLVC